MTIRLLIADDHEGVREGLRHVFHDTDVDVVAEAATGDTAVFLALERECDVVLLDLSMPGGDGLTALARIKSAKPDLAVLIYSAHTRADTIERCAALGASGYVNKSASIQALLLAVHAAYAGRSVARCPERLAAPLETSAWSGTAAAESTASSTSAEGASAQ